VGTIKQIAFLTSIALIALLAGCRSSDAEGVTEEKIASWSAEAGSDYAFDAQVAAIEVDTPDEETVVDIEVRGRFGFETSQGDYGSVVLLLYPEGGPSPTTSALRPDPRGALRLGEPGPPPEQGEGDHTWHFPGVAANGRIYELHVVGTALDGDGDQTAEVEGTGGSIEVRLRPPGPTDKPQG
jgi:hypothetical protein